MDTKEAMTSITLRVYVDLHGDEKISIDWSDFRHEGGPKKGTSTPECECWRCLFENIREPAYYGRWLEISKGPYED